MQDDDEPHIHAVERRLRKSIMLAGIYGPKVVPGDPVELSPMPMERRLGIVNGMVKMVNVPIVVTMRITSREQGRAVSERLIETWDDRKKKP
ncbi:MAG TPA: hypothetical protein VGK73_08785 [Polyangiaceae bacterium]